MFCKYQFPDITCPTTNKKKIGVAKFQPNKSDKDLWTNQSLKETPKWCVTMSGGYIQNIWGLIMKIIL